jgi:hypothetical protein
MGQTDGSDLLKLIQEVWQTDPRYVEEIENGFNWWPGHHKVTARCLPKDDPADPDAWRLTVNTEFIQGVNIDDPKLAGLVSSMGAFSPSYGWVYTPSEVSKKYNLPIDGAISFHSAACVRPETSNWLPAFFARIAIMQPIDAQRTAAPYAELLLGKPKLSGARLGDLCARRARAEQVGRNRRIWRHRGTLRADGHEFRHGRPRWADT